MTVTYTPIASQTLTASAASVTFSSIPGDYRDLVLVYRGNGSVFSFAGIKFNGSGTDYAIVTASGNGSSTASVQDTSLAFGALQRRGSAANSANCLVNVFDYAQTDKHKSYLSRYDHSNAATEMLAGRWGFTDAVTSLEVLVNSGTFASGSTFSLYGIAA